MVLVYSGLHFSYILQSPVPNSFFPQRTASHASPIGHIIAWLLGPGYCSSPGCFEHESAAGIDFGSPSHHHGPVKKPSKPYGKLPTK